MLDTSNLNAFCKGIADALRKKKGTTEKIQYKKFDEEIESITAEDTGIGSRQWWLDMCADKTSFSYMFSGSSLETIPQIDTRRGTDFSFMFYNCSNLKTIPQLNTSRSISFMQMFRSCSSLTTIPQLDTSKGTSFSQMFRDCSSLTTIPQLDTSKGTGFINMFRLCYALENIAFVVNCIKQSISFEDSPLLSGESIQSIIDGLATVTTSPTLTLNSKVTLTNEQIETINSKGWNLAYVN